jgi:hypothetical protein
MVAAYPSCLVGDPSIFNFGLLVPAASSWWWSPRCNGAPASYDLAGIECNHRDVSEHLQHNDFGAQGCARHRTNGATTTCLCMHALYGRRLHKKISRLPLKTGCYRRQYLSTCFAGPCALTGASPPKWLRSWHERVVAREGDADRA